MSRRSEPTWWQWVKPCPCLLVVGGLFLGCSSAEEGGTAEFRQKFEQPAVAPPVLKEKPMPYKDMSPREKKLLKKEA
ncbi:hypothetical protein [Singulisphaera acidiphila]|uniref:Uncharacterized protein n=1 Tax=Singulisphaera acidiphila (strain ATCC BAA-1392 / DSM 18658 / VKM B-2454 / MOB10) TaxID=886293 RepID=L0DFJ3_SINAD|nr:hypothetical protein [Singulisphaera acidiphila]AGA27630.1 hypothetical protein Sinac_3366 [Singulisphaera acidiphila DSM 18658]